jgi:hypothetical protein
MGAKPDPKELLEKLINTQDLTPKKVRELVNDGGSSGADSHDIELDTAINYFKLNRK